MTTNFGEEVRQRSFSKFWNSLNGDEKVQAVLWFQLAVLLLTAIISVPFIN